MVRIFLLFFLVYNTLHATLILNNDTHKYDDFSIEYYYDESASLTVEEINNTSFTKQIPNQFTQGYKYGDAWFKFQVYNNSQNEKFILYFTESIWTTLNLYTSENSNWKVQKNGLDIPLSERLIQDSSPAFNLEIDPKEKIVFYVKGNTIASQIGEFQIFTEKEYYNPSRISITQWYIIYSFVLFSFVLINLYNYLVTRESIYVYYMGYVTVYIVFSFMHSGAYISFGLPNWQEGLHTLGSLTIFALLQFSKEFLKLESTFPVMNKVFNILSVVAIIFSILLSQNILYSTVASNVFFSGTLIFIVYVALKALEGGFHGAKYYLIALMIYLPSMAMMAMNFNTLLANTDLTRYLFLGGAFIEIFLFMLILAHRYKEVNYEKISVQNALIEEKDNQESRLKQEIVKKTRHLTQANNLLKTQTEELEKIKVQLTKEATTDMLSGLYNRRYFFEASQKSFYEAMRYSQKISIMMIDIDHFKKINDTFGHLIGDRVIRILSNILKKNLRQSDILARYGGEEFVILLPHSEILEAAKMAERIRLDVQNEEVHVGNDESHNVTISIGLTELNHEKDVNLEDIILRADKALYNAKNTGRNKVSTSII